MTIRAGLVGLGWWGRELAEAAARSSDIRIQTCCSPVASERDAFAERYGARPLERYEDILADPDIEAVILATPHSLHCDQVIAAARAGKHVFVEKPFTLTAETGRRAARACSERDVVLAVGHNRRFTSGARAIKGMVADGRLGTILHVEGHFSSNSAMKYRPEQWRARREEAPAGALASIGLHLIDVMAWTIGPIRRVSCLARRQAVPVDIDDTTSALLEFENGVTGYLGTHFACPLTFHFHISATGGNLEARSDFAELTFQPAPGAFEPIPVEPVDTVGAELAAFAAACRGGPTFPVRPEEAIHNVAVMEAMAASARADGAWQRVGAGAAQ